MKHFKLFETWKVESLLKLNEDEDVILFTNMKTRQSEFIDEIEEYIGKIDLEITKKSFSTISEKLQRSPEEIAVLQNWYREEYDNLLGNFLSIFIASGDRIWSEDFHTGAIAIYKNSVEGVDYCLWRSDSFGGQEVYLGISDLVRLLQKRGSLKNALSDNSFLELLSSSEEVRKDSELQNLLQKYRGFISGTKFGL